MQQWICYAGSVGVIVSAYLPQTLNPPMTGFLLVCTTLSFCAAIRHRNHSIVCVTALLTTFLFAQIWASELCSRLLPEAFEQKPLVVHGYIDGLVERQRHSGGTRFPFVVESSYLDGGKLGFRGRVRLSIYPQAASTTPQLLPGQRWQLTVSLKRPHGYFNRGQFDYQAWLLQHGFLATGYVRSGSVKMLEGNAFVPLSQFRNSWRDALLNANTPGVDRSIQLGLSIGDKSLLRAPVWETLQATGTVHLLVISGLHVGMLSALGFFLTSFLVRRIPLLMLRFSVPQCAAVGAIVVAWLYASAAGLSLPTLRAAIMVSVFMLALILRRQHASFSCFSLALLLVLLCDPLGPHSAGFWLSFGMVFALLWGHSQCRNYGGLLLRLLQLLTAQWRVFVAGLFLLYQLGLPLSFCAPLANIIAIPLVSMVLVPLALLDGLSLCLWGDALPALSVFYAIAENILMAWLHWVQSVGQGLPRYPIPWSPVFAALLALACLLLLQPAGFYYRAAAFALMLPVLFNQPTESRGIEIQVLDVGQGSAVVVQNAGRTLVYDTGPGWKHGSAARHTLIPNLQRRGLSKLDLLVVSHGDNDHAGGAIDLLQRFKIERLVYGQSQGLEPVLAAAQGLDIQACRSGETVKWGALRLMFFNGADTVAGSTALRTDNRASCVLLLEAWGRRVLLPGDIDSLAESWVLAELAERGIGGVDVLMAPHHGSISSSSIRFVKTLAPAEVIHSAGYRNRFRHPHPRVWRRYHSLGSRQWLTARDGGVQVWIRPSGEYSIDSARAAAPRFWHSVGVEEGTQSSSLWYSERKSR